MKTCGVFSNSRIPSGPDGPPRVMTIACTVLGVSWTLLSGTLLRDDLTKGKKAPSVWMNASYQGDFPSISTVQPKAEDSADLVPMMCRCIFEDLQALHVKGVTWSRPFLSSKIVEQK